jgi:Calcium binding
MKKRIAESKARENRIRNQIIVDAYNSDEVMMSWLVYLEDLLACPFEAECIEQRKISPLRKGEKVTVLQLLADEDDIGGNFFVQIEWGGRKMGVPLTQLKPLHTDKETKQAIEDWQYWWVRGGRF